MTEALGTHAALSGIAAAIDASGGNCFTIQITMEMKSALG
jgi:hypothetical protein